MCGILGTLPPTEKNQFKRALDTLSHRGPDSYGIWQDSMISLGHRRLAILDVSPSGNQPMSYANERFQIVFNGEIYNFVEIRKELESLGYNFNSESDTEVVLASFIEWGDSCLLKFNGMWAIAIWDSFSKALFLARDRFGKKPLFYAQTGERFIFASEMKAILPFLPKVRPSDDFKLLAKKLFDYENTEKCLIHGIKRFPAGHCGSFKDGSLKIFRYWNLLDHLVIPEKTYEAQVEKFRDLFFDACKIRMRSDVPIGTALSGGLDSSATISAMSYLSRHVENPRGSSDWQHAFVASFPGTPIDETAYAKIVTDYLGIEATYVNIDPLKSWGKLKDFLYLFEEIYLTPPIPALMTYEAVRSRGVTVTLDGHGADELFSGYGHILEALWDAGIDPRRVKDVLDTYLKTISGFSQRPAVNRAFLYCDFILRKSLKRLLNRGPFSKDYQHPNFQKMDNFSQQLYIIFNETILPTLLRNFDRCSMINSVEIRMPFMDHRLVTYAHSLPYSSKFGQGFTKKIVRDAMSPFMPAKITWRTSKIGFNSPIVDWMQGPLKNWFQDVVHSSAFASCDLVDDHKSLRKMVTQIISGQDSQWGNAEAAWTALTPFLWEQAMIKREYTSII